MLELIGRPVADGGMQPLSIVYLLDEDPNLASGMLQGGIGGCIDLLLLEGLHEALGFCIVIGIAGSAHAGMYGEGPQAANIVHAGILYPPVGMMDQAIGARLAGSQSHVESGDSQFRS